MNLPPLDLAHPEMARDPHGTYRRYRELGPVHSLASSESSQVRRHFLLRHADVVQGMGHPSLVRSVRRSTWDEERRVIPSDHLACARVFREFVLFKDPPEHAPLRQPINRMLRRVATPGFRDWVAAEAEVLARSLPDTGTVDLVASYAVLLVSQLVGTLLGAGDDYSHHEMNEAATFIQLVMSNRHEPRRLTEASTRMVRLEQFFRQRLEEPPGSRADAILLESVLKESMLAELPPQQIRSTAIFLLIAARDNVRSALAQAVLCLLLHPGTWRKFRENPDGIAKVVEEVLRYEPAVHFASRNAAADLEIGGTRISAGDGVTFGLASANRDPNVYVNPDQFDPHRDPGPNAAFGFGIHRCPGITLARIMIEEGLKALLLRWPDPSLALPPEKLEWVPSSVFRIMSALPVRVG